MSRRDHSPAGVHSALSCVWLDGDRSVLRWRRTYHAQRAGHASPPVRAQCLPRDAAKSPGQVENKAGKRSVCCDPFSGWKRFSISTRSLSQEENLKASTAAGRCESVGEDTPSLCYRALKAEKGEEITLNSSALKGVLCRPCIFPCH